MPYVMMLFVVIFYAGNLLVGKAINELPPITIAFSRVFIAFIALAPFGLRSAWKQRQTFWEYRKPFLVMALMSVTLFNTFIYTALQFTSSTNASVLESVIPAVTVVASAFLLKERLRGVQKTGVIVSLIGAVWVVLDGRLLDLATMDWNVGDGIMIGAIASWVVYSIMVKKYMHLFPQYGAVFVMSGISVIVLFPIVVLEWAMVGVPGLLMDPAHIAGLTYLGIFPSFIALVLYNRAVVQLGASKTNVFLNFLPVVTMIGAYLWLGESITLMKMIGALGVIGGVILTMRDKKVEAEFGVEFEYDLDKKELK